jgi:hypothetical protein
MEQEDQEERRVKEQAEVANAASRERMLHFWKWCADRPVDIVMKGG